MNGQADSMRAFGCGSRQPSSEHRQGNQRGEGIEQAGRSVRGTRSCYGQQTLDFWLNLCICHTLIVEEAKDGGQSVFQVLYLDTPLQMSGALQVEPRRSCVRICAPALSLLAECMWQANVRLKRIHSLGLGLQGPSPDEVALVEGGRQLGFEFISRDRTTITIRMLGDEVSLSAQTTALTTGYLHAQTAAVQGCSMQC